MNYHKVWKKRKKTELLRLIVMINDFMLKANEAKNWIDTVKYLTQAALARDQFYRVLSTSFKRRRGKMIYVNCKVGGLNEY